jgi:hypothetical protein
MVGSVRRALLCSLALAACSTEDKPDTGTGPKTCPPGDCSAVNRECGRYFDENDNCTYCGDCVAPLTCGGTGREGTCGCLVPSCAQLGKNCGELVDPCGGPPVQCGSCADPDTCGGSGTDNLCGHYAEIGEACGPSAICRGSAKCCPRGGADRCVTPNLDDSCPTSGPDLIVDRPTAIASLIVSPDYVAQPCDIEDGCLPRAGTYRLLRFTTLIANVGDDDLVVGNPQSGDPGFMYATCHSHYHYASYVSYELKTSTGQSVREGNKPGFCIEDTVRFDQSVPATPVYACDQAINGTQGIQKGWADRYDNSVACQWVDITNVPAGDYVLEMSVNYARRSKEADYDNNTISLPVSIP